MDPTDTSLDEREPGALSLSRLRPPEVFETLGTPAGGLSEAEARRRLLRYGPNTIRTPDPKPLYLKLLAHFTHLMALLLWAGGLLAFVGGMPQLGGAVWAVIFINAAFSYWQEYRAERAVEELRRLLPVQATVLRDGEKQQVPAEQLVPGDLLVVAEGDRISADGRLVEEAELRVDQSTLSGESHPARKSADPIEGGGLSRTELPNLVFAGTSAAAGTGKAVVFATGMGTEFGKIARLTSTVSEELSPLQREINRMTRVVTLLAVTIGVLFFLLSVTLVGQSAAAGFIFAVGMVVAFVPEGLLPTVTLSLAMGVQRMSRRNAVIKKLSSVETLGCCSVICTDKTGTLTQNEMTVRELWAGGRLISVTGAGYAPQGELVEGDRRVDPADSPPLRRLLVAAALCNDARLLQPVAEHAGWRIIGDPTEAALKVLALKAGIDPAREESALPRSREHPFESRRKRMSTVHRGAEGQLLFVKGAPREVLELCCGMLMGDGVQPLTAARREAVLAAHDAYAVQGLRVLAVAQRELPELEDFSAESVERELVLLGLVAMFDPPRPEVAAAVATCRRAGIRVIMITGDYGLTAESIARRIGIIQAAAPPRLVSGAELDALDDDSLAAALAGEVIFARAAPEHKLRVVSLLQAQGHVVAVTGDGVNDCPALKKADIGIAMGLSGNDAAKEAAEMILVDDNFASIVNAIEEGRGVYANIRKFVGYIFCSNVSEAWPFILQIMLNVPLALTVMQVLAIDLGTDILPALALGAEPPEPGIMDQPPRSRKERLVDRPLLLRSLLWLGNLQALLCFSGFFLLFWSFGYHDLLRLPRPDLLPYSERLAAPAGKVYLLATTVYLAGVVTSQIGNACACRTRRISVFSIGLLKNRLLLSGFLFELLLLFCLLYLPPLQRVFEVLPLPGWFWLVLICYAPIMFLAEEGRKALARKLTKPAAPAAAADRGDP